MSRQLNSRCARRLPPTTKGPIRRSGPLLRDSPRQTVRTSPRDDSCIVIHRTDPDQAEQQPSYGESPSCPNRLGHSIADGRVAYLEGVPDDTTRCRPHRCRVPLRTFRPRLTSNSRRR
ncbi:hypothetical protein SEA_FLAGSTAFF_62 [Mycobacterium phage FlagStaff]|uniref:Uncharacterized protein n=1 Tax=Mycobacterium phage FlagStaff TaxID=1647304 RepID=A0A0F6YQA5_9CAUD|nr:hypothetical protein AVT49_gp62 [Mycobacterium phage FlagStaff]AKF14499.1 hypothetical protein SEA_FLAGSTAFF_62 [Mycobacterium phage FlagStaff]